MPDILQQALEETIALFPIFRSVLRKGLFWNYLEESRYKPIVTQEWQPICRRLYNPDVRSLLFEVTYFEKRINFEVFHALTDGTGAMQFLKALVSRYLQKRYPDRDLPALDYDASPTQKSEDSFQRYYNPDREQPKATKVKKRAYQIKGVKTPESRLGVIEGRMAVKDLLEIAHQHNTTLTVLLAAVMIDAIHRQMILNEPHQTVVLSVPVNLRNYFDSATARNFFGVVNVGYSFRDGSGELDDIIAKVDQDLKAGLTKENLGRIISEYIDIEKNLAIRIVPLPLKNLVLRIAAKMSEKESTSTISNIGKTNIPPALQPYIRMFSVICSTSRLQACLCSCNDLLTVSFSSAFQSHEIEKHFFRTFAQMGVAVEVASNICEREGKVTNVNPFRPKQAAACITPEQEKRIEKRAGKQIKKIEKQAKKAKKQTKKTQKQAQKAEKKAEKQQRKALRHTEKADRKSAKKQAKREKKQLKKQKKGARE